MRRRAVAVLWLLPWIAAAVQAAQPRVHRVAGGPAEMYANAYVIEGEAGLVVIDSLLTRAGSARLRSKVDEIGKPLLAVIVTHGHPDHYGGVVRLVAGREFTAIVAVKGVDTIIRRDDAAKGDRLAAFGIDWAPRRAFPNVQVEGGITFAWDDISLTAIDIGPAESHHDSAWILDVGHEQHAFVGDLVMEGVHAYVADGHTQAWLAALARLEDRLDASTSVHPGHGDSGGYRLLRDQAAHIERFRAEVRSLAAGQQELSEPQVAELERRMVDFTGHDRVARWIAEGADAVARELAEQELN